jgi:hypothetical protein
MRPCYYRILASYNQISASNTCIWTWSDVFSPEPFVHRIRTVAALADESSRQGPPSPSLHAPAQRKRHDRGRRRRRSAHPRIRWLHRPRGTHAVVSVDTHTAFQGPVVSGSPEQESKAWLVGKPSRDPSRTRACAVRNAVERHWEWDMRHSLCNALQSVGITLYWHLIRDAANYFGSMLDKKRVRFIHDPTNSALAPEQLAPCSMRHSDTVYKRPRGKNVTSCPNTCITCRNLIIGS